VHDSHKGHLLHHVVTIGIVHVLLLLDVVIYYVLISSVTTIFFTIAFVLNCSLYVV
jgi:hypothetical protein